MKARLVKTTVIFTLLFIGIIASATQAQAHFTYVSWGGGSWACWRPPISINVGFVPAPVYYYPAAPVIVTPPTPVFYQPSYASNSVLIRVQTRLSNLGYYTGSVDGAFGPATRRAVQIFQNENGLPVSGRLDSQTLRCLKI